MIVRAAVILSIFFMKADGRLLVLTLVVMRIGKYLWKDNDCRGYTVQRAMMQMALWFSSAVLEIILKDRGNISPIPN